MIDFEDITADELDEMMKRELLEREEASAAKRNVEKKQKRRGEGKALRFAVEKGGELMPFLIEKLQGESRTTVKSYLSHRQVAVNGIPTTQFNKQLAAGDEVAVSLGLMPETFKNPFLRIIYEDDYIVVADKKSGLLTMGTDRERQKTAYYILSEYLKAKERSERIFIIHRLDRETSGVVLFAKSKEVQHAFQYNWNETVLERKYIAVVEGKPEKDEDMVRSYLAENSQYHVYSTRNRDEGELVITAYRCLKRGRDNTLVELELETGKKNQIRVHMSDLGHPVVGDRKYGAGPSPIGRMALHASKIRFVHPVTGQEMAFDTGVPATFNKALKAEIRERRRY